MVFPKIKMGGSSNGATTELPPCDPSNPLDITTQILREVGWSANTPPPILGRLDPPARWYDEKMVDYMRDAAGALVLDASGSPIREFGIPIPRYLSSKIHKLEPWRLEAYFRSSKAFTYRDMWARQPNWVKPLTTRATNTIGNKLGRHGRDPFNARCWSLKHSKKPSKAAVKLLEQLTQVQIDHNTTWVVTLAGIHPPKLPRYLIPLDSFIEEGFPHVPSTEVQTALSESRRLMGLAGMNGMTSWHELEVSQLPLRWKSSNSNKVAESASLTTQAIKSIDCSERRATCRSETSEDAEGDSYELFMAVEDTTTKQLPFRNPPSQGLYAGQPMYHNVPSTSDIEAHIEESLDGEKWRHGRHDLHGGAYSWRGPHDAGAVMQDERLSPLHRMLEQHSYSDPPTEMELFANPVYHPSWVESAQRHVDVMTNPYNLEVPMEYVDGRGAEVGQDLAVGGDSMEDQEYYQGYSISYAGPSQPNQFGYAGYIPVPYDAHMYGSQCQR